MDGSQTETLKEVEYEGQKYYVLNGGTHYAHVGTRKVFKEGTSYGKGKPVGQWEERMGATWAPSADAAGGTDTPATAAAKQLDAMGLGEQQQQAEAARQERAKKHAEQEEKQEERAKAMKAAAEDDAMDESSGDDEHESGGGGGAAQFIDGEAAEGSKEKKKKNKTRKPRMSAVKQAQQRVEEVKALDAEKLEGVDEAAEAQLEARDAAGRQAIATQAAAVKRDRLAAEREEVNAEELDYGIDEFETEHAVHAALFDSLQGVINPTPGDDVEMTAAERDRRDCVAADYAEYVRKLAAQQKAINARAFRLRNVKIRKEKQRQLKQKADKSRKRQKEVKSAAAEQAETLAEPAKERELSDKAKKRREARGMRAEGDPDAWWRFLPRDEDDDAGAGAASAAGAGSTRVERAQKMSAEPELTAKALSQAQQAELEYMARAINAKFKPMGVESVDEQPEPKAMPQSMAGGVAGGV